MSYRIIDTVQLSNGKQLGYKLGDFVYLGTSEITADILEQFGSHLMNKFHQSGYTKSVPAIKPDGTWYQEKIFPQSFDAKLYSVSCRALNAAKELRRFNGSGGEFFHGFSTFIVTPPIVGEYVYISRGVRVFTKHWWIPNSGLRCIFPEWVQVKKIISSCILYDHESSLYIPGQLVWQGGFGHEYSANLDEVVYREYKTGTPAE